MLVAKCDKSNANKSVCCTRTVDICGSNFLMSFQNNAINLGIRQALLKHSLNGVFVGLLHGNSCYFFMADMTNTELHKLAQMGKYQTKARKQFCRTCIFCNIAQGNSELWTFKHGAFLLHNNRNGRYSRYIHTLLSTLNIFYQAP